MLKKTPLNDHTVGWTYDRLMLCLKLCVAMSTLIILSAFGPTFAQKVSVNVEKASVNDVFFQLTQQTGYTFTADASLVNQLKPLTINVNNTTLDEILTSCFKGYPAEIIYNKEDKIVVIKSLSKGKLVLQTGIDVKGKITDDTGQPLSGVSIRVKNQNIVTTAKANGEYSIKATDKNSVLVFSFVGYAPQEIAVGGKQTIDVQLKKINIDIEETVVVAYGTVTKADMTGSVGSVNIEDMTKAPVAAFTQALAGRIAGLQVSSAEGQPGMLPDIVIRGPGTLTQDASPLYVVDGFAIDGFNPATLNSNDIEDISVLKDASATALYGARAANGVIVIETKKGKTGKPQVSINSTLGIQQIRKKIDVMNAYEFVKYQSELFPDVAARRYFTNGKDLTDYEGQQGVNWQDQLFRTSMFQQHDVSIMGGNHYTRYAMSGSLMGNNGIIINTGADRKQGRIALDHSLSQKLKVGLTANYSINNTNGAQASTQGLSASTNSNAIFYPAFGYRPVSGRDDLDLSDENMDDLIDPNYPNETRVNPVKQANNTFYKLKNKALYANSFVSYNFTKDLVLKVTGNISDVSRESEEFYSSKSPRGLDVPQNVRGVQGAFGYIATNVWSNENTLSYTKRFKKSHRLNALLGLSAAGGKAKSYGVSVMNIQNEELGMSGLDEGTPYLSPATSSNYTMASYFGRFNYYYKSKYIFTATFRADGSSKFPVKNRWGYFPSGAIAWNLDQEKFVKKIKAISTAKLRMSFGHTGNNGVSNFAYLPSLISPISNSYSFNNSSPDKGIALGDLGNENLKWETTEQFDLGMDITLFKKRIGLTADIYRKLTRDMLLNADLPFATGYMRVFQNIGRMKNEGLELTLTTQNIVNRKFRWESNFNISFNRNQILALNRKQKEMLRNNSFHFQYTESFNISKLGEQAGQFYGYQWLGNYQYTDFDQPTPGVYVLKDDVQDNGSPRNTIQPGDIKYADRNGDGKITDADKTVIGSALAKHYGGFNNNFTYGNFDLNIFFQWSYGNNIYNANRLIFEGNSIRVADLNQFVSYSDRWTPENQNSKNYRTNGGGPVGFHSSRVIEDGSFLRLKTISLGYSLPSALVKKMYLSTLVLTCSAQNLFTWANYSGFDPEVAVRNSVLTPGLDYSSYPHSKTMVFGLKAGF